MSDNSITMSSQQDLRNKLDDAVGLIDDVVLKKYLHELSNLEVVPLPDDMKDMDYIRMFRITEMVYQNNEYSTYKLASVFSSLQNQQCNVFLLLDSNGSKTDIYMGIRNLNPNHGTTSLNETLMGSLHGEFPGIKTYNLEDTEIESIVSGLQRKSIASVSCIAGVKDNQIKDNEAFIQGLEKIAIAMQGQKYSLVVIAKNASETELDQMRKSYETISTQLSPFANMQLSYGTNAAVTISESFSRARTTSASDQTGTGHSTGWSRQKTKSHSDGESSPDTDAMLAKAMGSAAIGAISLAAAPLTGGVSVAAAAALGIAGTAINLIPQKTNTSTDQNSTSETDSKNYSFNKSHTDTYSDTETNMSGKNNTSGNSKNIQLTMQNKTLQDMIKRIDDQLQRIDECESLGMWECAAYVMSDSQGTAEMVAGMYKALMKGSKSGVEASAINIWNVNKDKKKSTAVSDYVTNFLHPIFLQDAGEKFIPVSAASLISSNELAIEMGLPRKSVCGFPVIEHAIFGQEIISAKDFNYNKKDNKIANVVLGNIYNLGTDTGVRAKLDLNSLSMHTFITGSTGSGKSNTIYQIINETKKRGVKFLIIEPAKGEYKDIFGNDKGVDVYGTNPKLSDLLRLNPFSFPKGIHVYEHIDRLVEIFNVCWPMYAAMPAVLKDAIVRSYSDCGWDLTESTNRYGENLYPTFYDVASNIRHIIDSSEYDTENKGAYKGSLLTRLNSLTNGINGLIFTSDEILETDLFDKNVIVDLSRVGSSETKALLMGVLVLKLQEHRMSERVLSDGKNNTDLKHLTVLEEAHNILKRTSTEQPTEGGNLIGKSVEMLSNAIAEMRTYGEGFIIADQAPGLMDMSVIRNTNTKIIMRLPDEEDRKLVGKSANLDDDQIKELAKLPCGVAAVYQNEWIEPVLCKVNEFKGDNGIYVYEKNNHIVNGYNPKAALKIADKLINHNSKLALEELDKSVVPDMRNLGLRASTQVAVVKLLSESDKRAKMTKLAPIIAELFPSVVKETANVCRASKDYTEWTTATDNALKSVVGTDIDKTTNWGIIQLCIIYELINVENNEKAFRDWKHNGGLRW